MLTRTATAATSISCADLFSSNHSSWYAPRLIVACEKTKADSSPELSAAIVHNIGRAMFIFLLILAALMPLLYWRPRRYYIEHPCYSTRQHTVYNHGTKRRERLNESADRICPSAA
ncbi:MAG: hypothetical protein NVS3B5_22140 [Sphingomicrobium sp.]